MQNKTTREALLSIIGRLKNSKILFKRFYEKHKNKFDKIEANMDDYENDLNHLNKTLNIYKWLLFISKTKEELFENMELLMTRPDGTPMEFSEEMKDILFENSKPFQMFILLLELCRTKYKDVNFENMESEFEKMKEEQADMDAQHMLESLTKSEIAKETTEEFNIQEGSGDNGYEGDKLNSMIELSYINNEAEYIKYTKNINNETYQSGQIGGGSQEDDFNRNRFVKLCYALDKPLPLKVPTVEFLNFKFDSSDNRFCIDIEYPWWPSMGNMLPELFNKANIKQCMKQQCVQQFKNEKATDSPEKQECVKSCFISSQPSLFDFTFFPLWSIKKYDPYGVVGGGVSFIRFFMNQLDSTIGQYDPMLDKLFGYIIEAIGFIPIFGDMINWISHTFEDIADRFGDNLIPWFDAYLNIIDKNFEEGFAIYAATIPNATKMASSSEATVKFMDKMMPILNKALSGIDMATGVAANINLTNVVEMVKGLGKHKVSPPNSNKVSPPNSNTDSKESVAATEKKKKPAKKKPAKKKKK
jgi:hypothetical protein